MSGPAVSRRPLFEIEREKAARIWLQFAALVATLFIGIWIPIFVLLMIAYFSRLATDAGAWVFLLRSLGLVFALTLLVAMVYWYLSRIGARDRLLRALRCVPLDPGDRYHQRLANIVAETRLATGGPRIECFTVPTLGLNAFSFSDLKGGGVVGVTEGALARLSRQQLQAVVAHEFGHILSGSYVTVTVSCLLFGIYTSIDEQMEDATAVGVGSGSASLGIAALVLRGWVRILSTASSLCDAALSRDRERQADLAAARFTRDPLSLAEALRLIAEHPGGAGSVPAGLAPLCIRDVQAAPRGFLARWRRTHPPIDERIAALLALANVSPADFERSAASASESFDRREHWSAAPTARVFSPAVFAVARETLQDSGDAARATVPHAQIASCPSCGVGLREVDYEGSPVHVCGSCGGCLVEADALRRILARREVGFTPEQLRLAEAITVGGDQLRREARAALGVVNRNLHHCPRCGATMLHRHFSYEHAIDVDRCVICDLVWFGKDELEVLQVLAERQVD